MDAAIAATTLALVLGSALMQDGPGPSPAQVILTLLACAALMLRRRFPVAILAFTLAASALSGSIGDSGGPIFIPFIIALFTAAAEGRLPAAVLFAVVGIMGMILRNSAEPDQGTEEGAILIAGWLVAVLAVGGMTWKTRAFLAEVEQRALEAERSREADGRRRAIEERMRIARELHDVLAHNISVVNVRSGAALFHLTDGRSRDPGDLHDELVEALTVIRNAGRDAGRELRATLGVLRQADEEASTAPAPGLARLLDLVDTVERAGLKVRTTMEGSPQRVPAEVDLAAFRIVQEALTNVARHADTRQATLRIRFELDDVLIQVENAGARACRDPGYGIQGMRERATALGGEVSAGPCGDGGFQVRARLPMREHA
ncbi:sensor histidine kinase [Actinomadura alba]|uniref:histidine kinase n=1 Tax=Actinomadura alba TaxID=406431 RepID=A0ABR7LU32_9ACTN|nr:histidine kinase [Actinomadura alba]MBC6468350.1 sensor histidine kinase [Actinomadura alba]